MTLLEPPVDLQNRTDHTAQGDRLLIRGLVQGTTGGVGKVTVPLVTQDTGSNMNIKVGIEHFFIPGTEDPAQGMYHAYNDGVVTLAVTAAAPSLSRIDSVAVYVEDSFYSGSSDDAVLAVIAGVAGSGVGPTLPDNALLLANVAVAAGVTSINNGNITQKAMLATGVGGVAPVNGSTEYPASPFDGQLVYDKVLDQIKRYDGTAWDTYIGASMLIRGRTTLFTITDSTNMFPVSYDVDEFDAGDDITFSGGVYTVHKDGVYDWAATVNWDTTSGAGAHHRLQRVYINGSLPTNRMGQFSVDYGGDVTTRTYSAGAPLHLSAGDTVQLALFQNGGVTMTATGIQFSLKRVA